MYAAGPTMKWRMYGPQRPYKLALSQEMSQKTHMLCHRAWSKDGRPPEALWNPPPVLFVHCGFSKAAKSCWSRPWLRLDETFTFPRPPVLPHPPPIADLLPPVSNLFSSFFPVEDCQASDIDIQNANIHPKREYKFLPHVSCTSPCVLPNSRKTEKKTRFCSTKDTVRISLKTMDG